MTGCSRHTRAPSRTHTMGGGAFRDTPPVFLALPPNKHQENGSVTCASQISCDASLSRAATYNMFRSVLYRSACARMSMHTSKQTPSQPSHQAWESKETTWHPKAAKCRMRVSCDCGLVSTTAGLCSQPTLAVSNTRRCNVSCIQNSPVSYTVPPGGRHSGSSRLWLARQRRHKCEGARQSLGQHTSGVQRSMDR